MQGGNPNAGVNNLQRVGFHGIPTQFKPPQVLSEGDRDRMRVALAHAPVEDVLHEIAE